MKLWLSRSSEVPIQEQLSTQLILGIVSADLAPGERLPSTTELARRFHVHANTVRAAYRGLADRGWVEWRQGSGFYVHAIDEPMGDPGSALDHLISRFLKVARDHGHTLREIQAGMTRWLSVQAPDHILVIEPDVELRQILIAEIKEKVSIRIEGSGIDESSGPAKCVGAIAVALSYHAEQIRAVLPTETPLICLHSSSIPKILSGERKPSRDELITIVSRWHDFLVRARATLVAVGVDSASLDVRDARQKAWSRGLGSRSFIITDSLLASRLPKGCRPRIFQVISGESISEIRTALNSGEIHG